MKILISPSFQTRLAGGLIALFLAAGPALSGQDTLLPVESAPPVHNRGFEDIERQSPDDPAVKSALAAGWKIDLASYPWKWCVDPGAPGTLEIVEGISHTGERSAKLGGNGHLYYILGKIDPDQTYRASVWAKGEGKFTLFVYLYTKDSKCIGQQNLVGPVEVTGEWKQYTGELKIGNLEAVAVNPGLEASGTACYLDDFTFEEKTGAIP